VLVQTQKKANGKDGVGGRHKKSWEHEVLHEFVGYVLEVSGGHVCKKRGTQFLELRLRAFRAASLLSKLFAHLLGGRENFGQLGALSANLWGESSLGARCKRLDHRCFELSLSVVKAFEFLGIEARGWAKVLKAETPK